MQKDMKDWNDQNIWPFSCYGPSGSKPCLPGLEDLSEEEIRYETLMNDGVLPPSLRLSERLQQTEIMKQKYSVMSPENRSMIVSFF